LRRGANELSVNNGMNSLMVALLLRTGQLSPEGEGHVLDFDNQFLPTGKYDFRRGYKKANGYFPGIASIDNCPVYIEGRNGNSNVKFGQADTLKRTYALLRGEQKILKLYTDRPYHLLLK
jgi:hypothetical protein